VNVAILIEVRFFMMFPSLKLLGTRIECRQRAGERILANVVGREGNL